MGANYSTVQESRRAPIVPVAPTYYNKPSSNIHNWPCALPESRAPLPPPVAFSSDYKTPAANLRSTLPENKAAAATNRVTAFRSAARWKAYLEASKSNNKLIVINFTATWCGPCKSMEPTLNEFAAKYTDVEFVKIDVDELFDVSRQYKVQAMPTYLFLKNGKEVDKVTGARKEELQRKIEKHRI